MENRIQTASLVASGLALLATGLVLGMALKPTVGHASAAKYVGISCVVLSPSSAQLACYGITEDGAWTYLKSK